MDLEITDHTCMLNFHNSSDLAMNEPCLEVTMWLMIDSTDASFTKIERTDSMLLSRSQKVSNVYFFSKERYNIMFWTSGVGGSYSMYSCRWNMCTVTAIHERDVAVQESKRDTSG